VKASYHVTKDRAYWHTAFGHYQRQRYFLLRPRVQALIHPIIFGLFTLVAWRFLPGTELLFGSLFALMVVLSAIQGFLLSHLRLMRFVERYAGERSTYQLSEDGLAIDEPLGHVDLLWEVFPRACRFSDGILLLGSHLMYWLPDASLEGSMPDTATELVKTKTVLRNVA